MASSFAGLTINDTGYITLPSGTTSERPSASSGMLRRNSTTGNIEYYDSKWNDQDKLVVHLDASDSNSYSGSGSIWYDISGNGNHFQLYNSPTFTSGTPAYFTFNGTSQYAKSIKPVDMSYDGYFSIEITYYMTTNANFGCLWEFTPDWNANPGGFGCFINTNGGATTTGVAHMNSSYGQGARNFPISSSVNVWQIQSQMTANVHDSAGYKAWVNGANVSFLNSQTVNPSTYQPTRKGIGCVDHFFLGVRGNPSNSVPVTPNYYYTGRIATFKVWQSKRTDTQVLASYNSIKSRYGLS